MSVSRKVIIYLDQNFISDIAKMSLDDKKDLVKPELERVFGAIKSGANEEKFLAPTGWIHELETAAEKNPQLRDAIRSYQGYIGQVDLRPLWEVKNGQFLNALLSGCGVTAEQTDPWREAFRESPDKRMENFKIDVHFPDLGLGKLLPETAASLQSIRDTGVNEGKQYQLEIEASRKHYKNLLRTDFSWALRKYSIPIDRAEQFIDSENFSKILNIDIFSKLWSRVLADSKRKRGIEGDYNDIEFLSLYLPYCNVIATDHYMKTQVESLRLDQIYGSRVFSMRSDGLNQLASYLEELRRITPPANHSLFSVLAVMDKERPAFPVEFLKKLNQARSKFQSTGKNWNKEVYTEVFLLYPKSEHVILPASQEVRAHGPAAFNHDQWSEMLVFGQGFKRIHKNNRSLEQVVNEISPHLRGVATAIVSDQDHFDEDVRENDSYLFYDIEEAIKNSAQHTARYGIPILYPAPVVSTPASV